ncbi:alpha-glucanase [Colletotrichum truncatum]|uniref:Alpha-glucanase n=1 Tax=Colletotrichum truncatum TaxID=5467 RepID=A0ACC3YU50_COLTU|nr:alpha-glucanase [Colletotrichum truncatum]XP_036587698.1 alpha-glucanase [Colletotrichum truncatum]KAF6780669.1 alpha-glucanase [Colletotrichum truncatum]KAF6798640.1 alpha-glucanase [Colletotrichum truncatum]
MESIGAKTLEEDKKRLILEILSIVLAVIPFIGKARGALFGGVAMISRIASLVDVTGSAGFTAYDTVKDPKSAPFATLGLFVGAFGSDVRSRKEAFSEAAKAHKGLPASDLVKFGDDFVRATPRCRKLSTPV